ISDSAQGNITIDFSQEPLAAAKNDPWQSLREAKMSISHKVGHPVIVEGYPRDITPLLKEFPEWARSKATVLLSKPHLEGLAGSYLLPDSKSLAKGDTQSIDTPVALDRFWNMDGAFSRTVEEVRGDVVRVRFNEDMKLTRIQPKDDPGGMPTRLMKLKQIASGGIATHERESGYLLHFHHVVEFELETNHLDQKMMGYMRTKTTIRGERRQ